MTRRRISLASLAATLLLTALSGCAYLHKESPAPVPITAQGPSLVDPPVAPLYSELTQGNTALPELPSPPPPGAQPAPPPASVIVDTTKKPAHPARHHGRKGEIDVAERETHERETRDKESSAPEVAAALPEGQNLKVTAPTPSGDTSQPTPIGQLTAGPTQDTAGSRQEAADLIDSTQRGVNSLRNSEWRSKQNRRPDTQLPRSGAARSAQRRRRRSPHPRHQSQDAPRRAHGRQLAASQPNKYRWPYLSPHFSFCRSTSKKPCVRSRTSCTVCSDRMQRRLSPTSTSTASCPSTVMNV